MNYKELDCWKFSIDLTLCVYELVSLFPKEELFGLTSQIKRSVISIPSNIAEGSARKNDKEFIQFLYIALGSATELETQFIIAEKLSYISNLQICDKIIIVKKLILGMIKYLKKKDINE